MSQDLKPCPFCGAQPEAADVSPMNVECPSCGITGPFGGNPNRASAIAAWNRRAIPAGMVLVPIEPTQQMCQEGQWKAQEWPKFPLRIVPIWKAMLAAAKS